MKKNNQTKTDLNEPKCPKCGSALKPIEALPSGKRLQRCSRGNWNPEIRKTEGCDYVKWFNPEPEQLDEKCPKCASPVVMITTRFGKKLKKCITAGWNKETKTATGCDFVEWFNGSKEKLDEACPQCGAKLLLVTTANGKKMKKCTTAGWDKENKKATGCSYIEWLNAYSQSKSNGDENFPEYEI